MLYCHVNENVYMLTAKTMVRKMTKKTIATLIITAILCGCLTTSIFAVAPTEEVIQKMKETGRFDRFVEQMREKRLAGMDQGDLDKLNSRMAASANVVDTQNILVILVDFPNKLYSSGYAAATPDDFDSLLFSTGRKNPTGSMTEFYIENSYGKYVIKGRSVGWYSAGAEYEMFGEDGFMDPSEIVRGAVYSADGIVDFSEYDNDGDGYVDGIIVVHAGTGHEESGNGDEIHSHSSSLFPAVMVDGVSVRKYTIQPEETTSGGGGMIAIGVFCHEWGHVLGLPDLYDIDYSSSGLGRWSLMASGNYNNSSKTPASFDAWCKKKLGWLAPTRLLFNASGLQIPASAFNPVCYELSLNGSLRTEYWLVENRYNTGFDSYLPGEGIIIYHIDDNVGSNANEWHPIVFLEPADGKFDLQYKRNSGDGSDAWPYGAANNFHDKTVPDSKYYGSGFSSQVAVWNISPIDSVMTVDLEVSFTRPWIEGSGIVFRDDVFGNGNLKIEAGEKIQVFLTIKNEWASTDNITVTMTSDNPALSIPIDVADFGTLATDQSKSNGTFPFEFVVPQEYESHIDSFYFELVSDGGSYTTSFSAEASVGKAQILIVDDDNGDPENLEEYLFWPIKNNRIPTDMWPKKTSGSPDSATLSNYHVVMWLTGGYRDNLLTVADISALKGFLNQGGNLFLTGQGLAKQLSFQDSDFLNNYLKVHYIDSTFSSIPIQYGISGSNISDGLDMLALGTPGVVNQTVFDHLLPIGEGVPELQYLRHNYAPDLPDDFSTISYAGEYKSVFMGYGIEAMKNNEDRFIKSDTIMARILSFFGDTPLDVADFDGMAINLPRRFRMEQNFPNPFNPTTVISYTIMGSGSRQDRTQIDIFNVLGQQVINLVNRAETPGQYEVVWDGRDQNGQPVASGLFFYRIQRGEQSETRKMILLK